MEKILKIYFCWKQILEISISFAIVDFNDCASGINTNLKNWQLHEGYFAKEYCTQHDTLRMKATERKSFLVTK